MLLFLPDYFDILPFDEGVNATIVALMLELNRVDEVERDIDRLWEHLRWESRNASIHNPLMNETRKPVASNLLENYARQVKEFGLHEANRVLKKFLLDWTRKRVRFAISTTPAWVLFPPRPTHSLRLAKRLYITISRRVTRA